MTNLRLSDWKRVSDRPALQQKRRQLAHFGRSGAGVPQVSDAAQANRKPPKLVAGGIHESNLTPSMRAQRDLSGFRRSSGDSLLGEVARNASSVGRDIWGAPTVGEGLGRTLRHVAKGYSALGGIGADTVNSAKGVLAGFRRGLTTGPQKGANYSGGLADFSRRRDSQSGVPDDPVDYNVDYGRTDPRLKRIGTSDETYGFRYDVPEEHQGEYGKAIYSGTAEGATIAGFKRGGGAPGGAGIGSFAGSPERVDAERRLAGIRRARSFMSLPESQRGRMPDDVADALGRPRAPARGTTGFQGIAHAPRHWTDDWNAKVQRSNRQWDLERQAKRLSKDHKTRLAFLRDMGEIDANERQRTRAFSGLSAYQQAHIGQQDRQRTLEREKMAQAFGIEAMNSDLAEAEADAQRQHALKEERLKYITQDFLDRSKAKRAEADAGYEMIENYYPVPEFAKPDEIAAATRDRAQATQIFSDLRNRTGYQVPDRYLAPFVYQSIRNAPLDGIDLSDPQALENWMNKMLGALGYGGGGQSQAGG